MRYLAKRALRIFPALTLNILVIAFVLGPILTTLTVYEYFTSPRTFIYLRNIILSVNYRLPGVFEDNVYPVAVNGSLWTLPIEFTLYLITPIFLALVFFLGRWGRLAGAACIFALLAAMIVTQIYRNELVKSAFHLILELPPYFILGATIYLLHAERRLSLVIPTVALCAGSMISLGSVTEIFLIFALPYAVIAFGFTHVPLISKPAQYGDFSYGIYLWSFPVQQALISYFGTSMSPLENMMATLLVVIPIAALSWHLLEKPMLALKPARQQQVGEKVSVIA